MGKGWWTMLMKGYSDFTGYDYALNCYPEPIRSKKKLLELAPPQPDLVDRTYPNINNKKEMDKVKKTNFKLHLDEPLSLKSLSIKDFNIDLYPTLSPIYIRPESLDKRLTSIWRRLYQSLNKSTSK